MAFRFPLATVLALRQQKEEAEERVLASLAMQRQQLRDTLQRVEAELQQWTQARVRDVGAASTAAQYNMIYARLQLLAQSRVQLKGALVSMEERWRAQQQVYLGARTEREMLSSLKQQQEAAFHVAQDKNEQRRLDDLFAARRANAVETARRSN